MERKDIGDFNDRGLLKRNRAGGMVAGGGSMFKRGFLKFNGRVFVD